MAVIRMDGVTKHYDERTVLDRLDLTIDVGEIFALLGPNGAGKTTAVEILEGYREPDSGTVDVLGVDPLHGGPRFRSRIGIVLQHTTSFENLTVIETVEMFASLVPDPLTPTGALDLVGLADRADQVASTLSGGQRRRLDVACGIVGQPELLFLDEPTTGLDPEARRGLWSVISQLRDRGTTVLLTTHYLDEAEALADRIGILLDGRLDQVARPDRIGDRDRALATVRFDLPSDLRSDGLARLDGLDRLGRLIAPHPRPTSAASNDTGGTTTIEFATDHPEHLVTELVDRFGHLPALTVRRPSLEDVYLDLVNRSEASR